MREYLNGLDANRPKPGRRRSPEAINARLAEIETELVGASSWESVQLIQEKSDLHADLESRKTTVNLSSLEREFAKFAKAFSERKGIHYSTWRAVGIDSAVLKQAGISR
ncbi:MAG TPA: hypothetical protein DEP66_06140 [Acidimicrobiaceae bacterium]|nr:hypothetical protein [Acidimicrobiaceae bacterium]